VPQKLGPGAQLHSSGTFLSHATQDGARGQATSRGVGQGLRAAPSRSRLTGASMWSQAASSCSLPQHSRPTGHAPAPAPAPWRSRPISRRPKGCLRSVNSEGAAQASFWPGRKATVITGHALRGDQETKRTCPRIGKCAPSHRPPPPLSKGCGECGGATQHERMK